jgi:hypothetical protein
VNLSVTRTEVADGIHIRSSTNENNLIELVTARASTTTVATGTGAFIQNTWTNVAFYLDRTGTNVIAYMGNSPTNLVSVATNKSTVPNTLMLGAWINSYKLKASAGNVGNTNYIDYFKVWRRLL